MNTRIVETITNKSSSTMKTKNKILDDVFADADDDTYGLVRDPNFHDREYFNRRRRCSFIDSCNGNDDDDCCYLNDPCAAVICLRPILPSPYRELSYKPRTGWNYDPSTRNTPFLDRLGTGVAVIKKIADKYGRRQQKRRKRQSKTSEKKVNSDDYRFSMASPLPMPSTKMNIPISWTSSLSTGMCGKDMTNSKQMKTASDGAHEFNFKKRKNRGEISNSTMEGNLKSNKQPRLSKDNDAATIVSNSTTGDGSFSTNSLNNNGDTDRIVYTSESNCKDKIKSSAVGSVKVLPITFLSTMLATPYATKVAKINNSTSKQQKQQNAKSNKTGIVKIGLGSPKEALYYWFGKKPRKTQIKAEHYLTWDNGRMNDQQFTAIFVCPLTNEAFLAGPRTGVGQGKVSTDDNKLPVTVEPDKDGLYWYPRKIIAEHAAAARAWDCLMMREVGGNRGSRIRFCALESYWPSQRPMWPLERIPARILERLSPEQYSNTSNTDHVNKDNNEVCTAQKLTLLKADTNISSRTVDNGKKEPNDIGVVEKNKNHLKNNLYMREPTSNVVGQFSNYGGGHRRTQRQPSRKQNSSRDNYNDQKSKAQDLQQYRAQRMPYNQLGRYGQRHVNYQPRQEQPPITENNFSYASNYQRVTREHGQFDPIVLQYGQHQVSQRIQQQIPEQTRCIFPQYQQQNQYLQPQPANKHFHRTGDIHSHHNLQHNQQLIPPPPPPPPPPRESSISYSTSWNQQNQYQNGPY